MNQKSLFFTLTLLITSMLTSPLFAAQSLFIGTIQFPIALKKVPSLRVYYGGHKITGEPNNRTKQLIFSIPEMGESKKFHIVITKSVQFEMEEDSGNTVKYVKIAKNQPYKCCKIEQVKQESATSHASLANTVMGAPSMPETKVSYSWRVTKQSLDDSRQLPEDAIVICFSPNYIQDIVGGNKSELPRIIIKPNLLDIAGSEAKLHEEEIELLLSAVNSDALHTKVTQEMKNQNTKTIIACKNCV